MSRKTTPIITKYELASLLANRAAEIADGQPITIQNPPTTDPVQIAQLEFEAGKSPKKVKRVWPDGTEEIWALSELHLVTEI